MAILTNLVRRTCREGIRDEGTVTVAFTLWVPIMIMFFSLIADTALIFYAQARALQVAQDANREFSVGRLSNSEETERRVKRALSTISPNATARTQAEHSLITTSVTMPASDLVAVGFFKSITSFRVTVIAQMAQEF